MKKEDKLKEVSAIQYTLGNTYTADALLKVRTEVLVPHKGDRTDAQDLVVLITDGRSHRSRTTIKEAKLLKKKSNLHILAIGVTQQIDELELGNVSSGTKMFLKIQSFSNLDHELDVIKPIVCSGGIEDDVSLFFTDVTTDGMDRSVTRHGVATDEMDRSVTRQGVATDGMDRSVTRLSVATAGTNDYSWSRSPSIVTSRILVEVSSSSDVLLTSSAMFSLTSSFSASDKSSLSPAVKPGSSLPQSKVPIVTAGGRNEEEKEVTSPEIPLILLEGLLSSAVHVSKTPGASTAWYDKNEFLHSTTSPPVTSTIASTSVLKKSYSTVSDTAIMSSSRPAVTSTLSPSTISDKSYVSSSLATHFLRSSLPSSLSSLLLSSSSISSSVNPAMSDSALDKKPKVSHSVPSETKLALSLPSTIQPVRPTQVDPCGLLLNVLSYPGCQQQNCDHMSRQQHPQQQLPPAPYISIDTSHDISLNLNVYNYYTDQKKFNNKK